MHPELADVLIQTLFRDADVSADAAQFKTARTPFCNAGEPEATNGAVRGCCLLHHACIICIGNGKDTASARWLG